MNQAIMGSCVYCGRLTTDVEGICSHCQQRRQAKEMTKIQTETSKLDYWKDRAKELALTSGKVQVVVDYGNGSCQVWPKTLVGSGWNVVHETGGGECA